MYIQKTFMVCKNFCSSQVGEDIDFLDALQSPDYGPFYSKTDKDMRYFAGQNKNGGIVEFSIRYFNLQCLMFFRFYQSKTKYRQAGTK